MKKSYDILIIGSTPAALITAFELTQQGHSCAVVDGAEQLGGVFRPISYNEQLFTSHLEFVGADTKSYMSYIKELLPHAEATEVEVGPITFHNGQVQPFLGFGETSFDAIDEGVYLTNPQRLQWNVTTSEIIAAFKERFKGDILLQSQVTQIDFVDGVVKVQINSSDTTTAQKIYFFENPVWLSELLTKGQHSVPKSVIQKLGKVNLWTSVSLTFLHKYPLTEANAVHVLSGAKEQMCFGRFTTENDRSISQWVSFASPELSADSESLGAILREMKKQIKRMYPQFTESVEKEFISIVSNSYGQVPQGLVDERQQLAKAPLLFLGGRYYSQTHGLSGDFSTVTPLFSTPQVAPREVEASL